MHSDNRTGGLLAAEHLISRGSRSPVHITATDHPGNARAAAYREVMDRHGLTPRVMAYTATTRRSIGRRAAIETWLTLNPADGVFASDDLTALMALDWARKTGRRVPDDLRIVGYDGAAALRMAVPGLTTVRQPIERMAFRAVDLLRARMADATLTDVEEDPLPVELLQGWTS